MKVLLTGGTGFLGKWVLRSLLQNPSVTRITVVSRSKSSHPDPRVRVVRKDLADPSLINHIRDRVDCAIHLAGLYRFGTSFAENYEANVLGTQTLLDAIRRFAPTRILLASTYAVGIGSDHLPNSRLEKLPLREHAYAHTKALAERLIEAAASELGHQAEIFRLGILVGDSEKGSIEKLDGPYAFYRAVSSLADLAPTPLPLVIPADPDSLLPLVAVDEAARVIARAAIHPGEKSSSHPTYHAVFRTDSIRASELMDSITEEIRRRTGRSVRARFVKTGPGLLLKALDRSIPPMIAGAAENLIYANWRGALEGDSTALELSHWSSIHDAFFAGAGSAVPGNPLRELFR